MTGLIIAQAGLLARALAGAGARAGAPALGGTLSLLLAVLLARAAASYGGEVSALLAAAVVKARLRSRLTGKLLALGPAWLAGQRAGELTTLTAAGLDALDPFFARYLPQLLLAVAVPVAVLIRVTVTDWLSGLVIALTLPVIPVFAALVGLRAKERSQRQWHQLARLSGHFLDVVQGLTTLKLFGRAQAQERVIARITDEYRVSVMATLRLAFLSSLVLELSAALATALVAVEVGLRLLYGHLGYESALLVLLLTPEAYLPLRNAGAAFHASADGTQAAGRVFEILDLPGEPERIGAILAPVPDLRKDTILLKDVTVAYPGRAAPALRGVSLEIRPGDRITLTGPNGAGKSTLARLLLRFAEPSSGVFLAGDSDVTALPVWPWRAQIGWLPQEPWLFPWSVAENIALGRPSAGRAEIEAAAAAAGAAGFIGELADGYDTVLAERAGPLSAGQRQKLALARLFLADRSLLLLDEPTAHLDPVSAAEVDSAIAALAAGRTVLTITHREGAGAGASGGAGPGRLLTLRDGRLTEAVRPETSAPSGARVLDVPDVLLDAGAVAGDGVASAEVQTGSDVL